VNIQLDLTNIGDPDNIHAGGERPKAGRGMIVFTGFEEFGAVNGKAHKVDIEIVAWTDPDCVAMTHSISIFYEDRTGKGHPQKVMTALGMAAGLFNARDLNQWKAAGQMPDIDFSQIVGRPAMLQLVEEPDKDNPAKTYINVGSYGKGYYHIKDPRVKDWPKNEGIFNSHAAKVGDFVILGATTPPPPGEASTSAAAANPFAKNT